MRFGWKLIFPLALANTIITGFYLTYFRDAGLWPLAILGLIGFVLLVVLSDRVRSLWNTPTHRPDAERPAATRPLGGD